MIGETIEHHGRVCVSGVESHNEPCGVFFLAEEFDRFPVGQFSDEDFQSEAHLP